MAKSTARTKVISNEQMNLIIGLRLLITQFAYLTRDYIKSVIYNVGDSVAIANKLHDIPLEIKSIILPEESINILPLKRNNIRRF